MAEKFQEGRLIDPLLHIRSIEESCMLASLQGLGNLRLREAQVLSHLLYRYVGI